MKAYVVACITGLMMLSSVSFADTEIYQFKNANSYGAPLYPGLNLEGVATGKVVIDRTDINTINLNRIEVVFANANNLTLTQFKGNANLFHAVSTQGWVFKKIQVEVDLDPVTMNHVYIRGYVVENESQLNQLNAPSGPMLFDIATELTNITPNPLADSVSTMFNGKRAYIKLYQKSVLVDQNPEYQFVLDINHLGNGSYRKYYQAPPQAKATAFILNTIDGESVFAIRFKDPSGFESETPFERLDTLLNTNP